jgi:polar amino acid transport system substrate-binding protein
MRGKWLWCRVLALAALCFLSSQSVIAAEKIYINGIDANFPPFTYVDRSGNPDGFDVKALDWIAREMGFKVKPQPMDWDGIVPSLIAKEIDIVASGMSITEERKKQVSFSTAYWKIRQVLVAKRDAKVTAGQALADGNKIGVQRGTTEAKWIEENLIKKAGKKIELIQYDSALLAIEDVINGRIIAAAMDDAPALDAAKKKLVKILGGFGMADELFGYAIRKEDTEFLKKVNEGLKKLMKSPSWAELKKTYIER